MFLNIEDYRQAAKRYLPRFAFEYIDGAAEDEIGMALNRSDLDSIRLKPRVLRDTSSSSSSIDVFGVTWRYPFAVAPTGLNGLVRKGGDTLIAKAAAEIGIPFIQSTASNQRLEDVNASTPNSSKWLQLYVMQDRSIAEQLVLRAALSGYEALVLTVDVPMGGSRERDVRNGFCMPFHPTAAFAWDLITHPRWTFEHSLQGAPKFPNLVADSTVSLTVQAQAALLSRAMDRQMVWESLQWLRSIWKGPLLLKGVLHPDDAALALKHGVDGLVVSNHGGRQLDAATSAISALPGIVDRVGLRIPIFMDGGIRRGSDIARALALGAHGVLVGRPVLYGLAAAGQSGVHGVLSTLGQEFDRNMVLLGAQRPEDLCRSIL
jgi:(S)-mandelate dehydrogenase